MKKEKKPPNGSILFHELCLPTDLNHKVDKCVIPAADQDMHLRKPKRNMKKTN